VEPEYQLRKIVALSGVAQKRRQALKWLLIVNVSPFQALLFDWLSLLQYTLWGIGHDGKYIEIGDYPKSDGLPAYHQLSQLWHIPSLKCGVGHIPSPPLNAQAKMEIVHAPSPSVFSGSPSG